MQKERTRIGAVLSLGICSDGSLLCFVEVLEFSDEGKDVFVSAVVQLIAGIAAVMH